MIQPTTHMRAAIASLLVVVLLHVGSAHAAEPAESPGSPAASVARAEQLFNEATALEEAGDWAAACPKLEESHRLDPALGTQFNLAVCYEKIGRLGSAFRTYDAVRRLARATAKVQREQAADSKLTQLRERVAMLKVVVRNTEQSSSSAVSITLDGASIAREEWDAYPVDAGRHVIEATAPAKKPWQQTLTTTDGSHVTVDVPPLESARETKVVTITQEKSVVSTRRTAGFIALSLGAIGVAGAVVTGVMLLNDHSTADERCIPYCTDSVGRDAVSRGQLLLPINVVAWAVAAVGLGTGTYLLWTSRQPTSPR